MKWPRHLNERKKALMIVLDYAKYLCSSNTFFFFFFSDDATFGLLKLEIS